VAVPPPQVAQHRYRTTRTFPVERCLCPNILVWFFFCSYVTKGIRLRSAVLPF